MSYLSRLGWQAVGLAVAISLAMLLLLAYCSQRDQRQEAENARDFVEGRTLSAGDAIEAIHDLDRRDIATRQEAEEAINEIEQAPPDERNALARRRLCELQHRPDC